MKLNFLFMDECFDERTTISSLTGLLVPASEYAELRVKFYDILQWAMRPEEQVIAWPPELHGRNLLRGEDDNKKVQVVEQVVDFVISNDLELYRTGYYINAGVKGVFKGDEKMVSLCWSNMLTLLQSKIEKEMLIPVMDSCGPDIVPKFSGTIQNLDIMRAAGYSENLSIEHSENILGEVFYAVSKYSIFTQVADIVSYLRHVVDWSKAGLPMEPFKKRLLTVGERLSPFMTYERIVTMNIKW